MSTLRQIERLHKICDRALFQTDTTLDYDKTIKALTRLSELVAEYEGESEDIWYLNETNTMATVDLLGVGAYWFCSEHHGGQWSDEYALLSTISNWYDPRYETLDENDGAFVVLEALRRKHEEENQKKVARVQRPFRGIGG